MNTNDLIAELGGDCANFLDTGGKATSETVKTSFKVILQDPRVKAIFVNIFGGLTLCDMIAEGIMLAYKDLGIKLPVVVRLRGTNEKIGQKMVSLNLYLVFTVLIARRLRRVACLCTLTMILIRLRGRSSSCLGEQTHQQNLALRNKLPIDRPQLSSILKLSTRAYS